MARILLIDDEIEIRRTIGEMLRRLGHEVIAVADGVAGVEALDWSHIDLIITDIMMPERDGLEVIAHIRCLGLAVPIVVISGGQLGKNLSQFRYAEELGATVSLPKPFSLSKLRSTIEAVLSGSGYMPAPGTADGDKQQVSSD